MYKKALITLLLGWCALALQAYDFDVNGTAYCFSETNPDEVYVTYFYYNSPSYKGEKVIPATVTYNDKEYKVTGIGFAAFEECASLTSITLPETITTIDFGAFRNCTSLTEVQLPESITTLGDLAFGGCEELKTVNFPPSLTSIGGGAFSQCNLTNVTLPESVTFIGDGAFSFCKSLESINLPEALTSIEKNTFEYCTSLASISIPNNVTEIGEQAFRQCAALKSVTLGKSVTTISKGAFESCVTLESVTIPNSVMTIAENAFFYCKKMQTLSLGESVTELGADAFYGCTDIKKIHSHAKTPPVCHGTSLYSCNVNKTEVHVPQGTADDYKQAPVWSKFMLISDDIAGVEDLTVDGLGTAEEGLQVYTLQGIRLNVSSMSELQSLPKGIYVVNSKKIMVR